MKFVIIRWYVSLKFPLTYKFYAPPPPPLFFPWNFSVEVRLLVLWNFLHLKNVADFIHMLLFTIFLCPVVSCNWYLDLENWLDPGSVLFILFSFCFVKTLSEMVLYTSPFSRVSLRYITHNDPMIAVRSFGS